MKLNKVKAMLFWLITFIIFSLIVLLYLPDYMYPYIFLEIIIIFGLGWTFIEVHD